MLAAGSESAGCLVSAVEVLAVAAVESRLLLAWKTCCLRAGLPGLAELAGLVLSHFAALSLRVREVVGCPAAFRLTEATDGS